MNKKYLMAALVALITLPAIAQTERVYEYDEYGKVGRSEGWARRFAHNFYDGLIGAEYYEEEKNVTTVTTQDGTTTTTTTTTKTNANNVNKNYRHYGPGHTPDLYFGINLLCTDRPPVLSPGFPQKPGKGFEFGVAIGQWGYHMTKNIGVNTAFYLTRSRYWIGENKYLKYNDALKSYELTDARIDDRTVKQGYLRYWSLRVPLCLEISAASRKGPFIAVGPELEYRFADVSSIDFYGKKNNRIKGVNVNPLGLNAIARIGISDFGIMARYSLNSLFLNDDPVKTYPFMIGLPTSF